MKITSLSAFLIFLVAGVIVFFPVLNNGSVLYGTDTITHDYLMEIYGWGEIVAGRGVPLWMPYLFGGIPNVASFSFCPFYPSKIFSLVLKYPFAFNFQYFISSVLGGFFFYLFMRAFGRSKSGSVFGGLSFMLCGHFLTLAYPGHLAKFQAIAGIPLSLAFLRAGLDKDKFSHFIFSSAGFALSYLASHFQIAFYSVLLCSCYVLFFIIHMRREITPARFVRIVLFFSASVIFGILLASIQVMPGVEFSKISNRGDHVDYESATQGSYPPQETFEYVLPRFTGDSIQFERGFKNYWGWWGERLVSDYVGAAVIFLFVFGLFISRDKNKYFWLATSVISLLLAYGKFSIFWRAAYFYLPFFDKFRSPATIMAITSVAIISLAVYGFDEIFKDTEIPASGEKRESEDGIKWFSGSADFAYLCSSLGAILFGLFIFLKFFYAPSVFDRQLSSDIKIITLLKSMMHVLLFGGLAFIAIFLYKIVRAKALKNALIAIFILVVSLDLYKNSSAFINPIPAEPYHAFLYDNTVRKILFGEPEPLKILERGNELTNKYIFQNIASLHGYHPVAFKRYFDMLGNLGFYNLKFLQLSGCRYILTGDLKDLSSDYKIKAQIGGKALVDLGENFKYIYFPKKFEVVKNDTAAIDFLKNQFVTPDESSCVANDKNLADDMPAYERKWEISCGHYCVEKYTPDSIMFEIDIPAAAWCVVSEWDAPGWKAVLDGNEQIKIYCSNYFLKTLKIPAGKHQVELKYEPSSYKHGKIISLISICIFMLLGIAEIFILQRKNLKLKKEKNGRAD